MSDPRATWHPGGAARAALGHPSPPPSLADAAAEALERGELSVDEAHVAWELVRLAGEGSEAELALVLLLQDALSRGSTRLSLDDPAALSARARALLGASDGLCAELGALAAEVRETPSRRAPLFGPAIAAAPLVVEGGHLYAHRVRAAEARLAARLLERLGAAAVVADPTPALAELRASPAGGLVLADEQEEAVRAAWTEPLSVIRGGPGTGKTSVVLAILRAAVRLGVAPHAIALAAPTGKAADRTRESIERGLASIAEPSDADLALVDGLAAPRTLHRLLGYSPSRGGFRHHTDNPLSERLVIIDESSMIDLFLMDSLLGAMRPDARLVLLGDAEQLPSIAAGAVFRDLGDTESVPGVRLHKSHRMDPREPAGFNILSVARAMNAGRREPFCEAEGDPLRPAAPDRIARLDTLPSGARSSDALGGTFLFQGAVEELLGWWQARFGPRAPGPVDLADGEALGALFDDLARSRLLCVTRSAHRPTGVEAVNGWLHGPGPWRAGEPVLVHRNDYARGLFNGDQGLLLDVLTERGPRLCAVFRRADRFVAHPVDAIRGVVDLGYATTVHKAQGSEHDVVILLLPDTDSPRLLTREVIYTGITRARRAVILAGSPALLDRAAGRAIVRSTGVAERLADVR